MDDASSDRIQQLERRLTCLISLLSDSKVIDPSELDAMERELADAALLLDQTEEEEAPPAKQDTPPPESHRCQICQGEATRLIFNSSGSWKICGKPACLDELSEKYATDTRLTWYSRPLQKKG